MAIIDPKDINVKDLPWTTIAKKTISKHIKQQEEMLDKTKRINKDKIWETADKAVYKHLKKNRTTSVMFQYEPWEYKKIFKK